MALPHRDEEHEEIIEQRQSGRRVIRRVVPGHDVPFIEQEIETDSVVERAPWSPAQLIALAIGILFIVIGAIAVVRGGINDIYNQVSFGPFSRTPLMGFIDIGFGILVLATGSVPGIDRGGMTLLGSIALAWGIIVVVLPEEPFSSTLGLRAQDGWLYVIVGAITLLVAIVAPVVVGRDHVFRRVQH